jgi:PAS domain S-box-containing protein
MKKLRNDFWLFPVCLFIFLSIYLLVKFIFIFFFSAAYEPSFIFELTPLYLLSGLSNAQLLSLSLLVAVVDLLLHLRSSKQNLLFSFLPTTMMLASVGFTIMVSPMDSIYIIHYALFGLLLLVVLIDYQYILNWVQAPILRRKKEPMAMTIAQEDPFVTHRRSLRTKNTMPPDARAVPLMTESIVELKQVSKTMLQKMQHMIDDLERKTDRIEKLENQILTQQKILFDSQKQKFPHEIPYQQGQEKTPPTENNLKRTINLGDKDILKEKIENHLIIDEKNSILAIVQRGIFKEISNSFAQFLGYERTELLQKNFFVFISPRGFENTRQYYLNRLKGASSNSFRTVLRTKGQTEVMVKITVTPTIYHGDPAEFLSIQEIQNNS